MPPSSHRAGPGSITGLALTFMLLGACAGLSTTEALARGLRSSSGDNGDRTGFVVAESRFGNGTISGPVRLVRNGREVRLPGGTWIGCRRSCSETLRVETVDIWENRSTGNGITSECGVFGCLEIRYPR